MWYTILPVKCKWLYIEQTHWLVQQTLSQQVREINGGPIVCTTGIIQFAIVEYPPKTFELFGTLSADK